MRARLIRVATMGGGVVAAAILFAATAVAHGAPYTVTAGSAPTGTSVAVTGTVTGTVTFKDTTTNTFTVTCNVSVVKGSTTTGSSNGSPLGTINGPAVVLRNTGGPCTGPAGLSLNFTGYGTWNVVANDSTSGVTKGAVTNIRMHVQSAAGPTCAFDVGLNSSTTGFASSGGSTSTITPGTQGGTFTNSTQNLVIDPAQSALGLWNVNPTATVHNCWANSVLKQGDSVSLTGTYNLKADTAAYNPIAIG